MFTDENGDDKADKKEILLQGIGGKQHDHGMHAFVFGPDGKFYFNFGNEGQTLKDGNSQTVRISTIKSKKMIPNSLMLNGFHEAMSEQELAHLVAYLMTLKKKG